MPCLYGMTFAVSDIVSSVRPWNAWSNVTIALRPVWYRAIFTAFSTASAPEFANMVFLAWLARRERVQPLGELDVGLVGRHVEARVRVELGLTRDRLDHLGCACGRRSGRRCRSRSRSSRLPSTSSTIAPEARAVDDGMDRARHPAGRPDRRRANHSIDRGPGIVGDELAFLRDVHRTSLGDGPLGLSGTHRAMNASSICTDRPSGAAGLRAAAPRGRCTVRTIGTWPSP